MMSAISLRHVSKQYGQHAPVLRDVNLDIAEHEFCVFLGPSGCGKSTLLRMIAGLEDLTTGELCIDGHRMNETPPAERGVSMVFQSYALFPHMSVFDNIGFGLRIAGLP
jgi:multiple sugar transport system ATP-binding protein